MQKTRLGPLRLTHDYRQLQRQLAHIGYLSQGSVFERTPGQQGSRYVWTRKVRAKTITVALSQEQYQWLRQAVLNQRQLENWAMHLTPVTPPWDQIRRRRLVG